ncbi:hypothetical protein AAHB54_07780, partial [Bacillus cereus]
GNGMDIGRFGCLTFRNKPSYVFRIYVKRFRVFVIHSTKSKIIIMTTESQYVAESRYIDVIRKSSPRSRG